MSNTGYDKTGLAHRLVQIVGEDNVLVDEPMSEHTTFEIGGPADLFVTPDDVDEIAEVLEVCRAAEVPFFVLGCGSDRGLGWCVGRRRGDELPGGCWPARGFQGCV